MYYWFIFQSQACQNKVNNQINLKVSCLFRSGGAQRASSSLLCVSLVSTVFSPGALCFASSPSTLYFTITTTDEVCREPKCHLAIGINKNLSLFFYLTNGKIINWFAESSLWYTLLLLLLLQLWHFNMPCFSLDLFSTHFVDVPLYAVTRVWILAENKN